MRTDLPILALGYGDGQPIGGPLTRVQRHERRLALAQAAAEVDAVAQSLQRAFAEGVALAAIHLRQALRAANRRVGDVANQAAVIGEEEEAARILVEPAARVPALGA